MTASGRDVLLTSNPGRAVRVSCPARYVFILPPTPEALRARLEGRASETPEWLARRLSLARGEVARALLYDFVVVNDDLEGAYDAFRAIVLAARCRRERQAGRVGPILAAFDDWRP